MTWQLNNNNSPNIAFFCRKKYKTFPPDFFPFFFFDLLYLSASFPFLLHGPSSNAYNLIERFGSWSSSHCTVVIPEKYGFPLDFNY